MGWRMDEAKRDSDADVAGEDEVLKSNLIAPTQG